MNNSLESHMLLPVIAAVESEHSLIGALLLDNSVFDRISDRLKPEHFFSLTNRDIFAEITRQLTAGQNCDVVTIGTAMQGKLEMSDLAKLAQYVPSAANIHRYADAIVERHTSRGLLTIGEEITELARDHGRSIDERVELAQNQLSKLTEGGPKRDDWQESGAGMVVFIDEIQRQSDGEVNYVPTSLAAIDDQLDGGGREGELIAIGARPGMGKTALALTIADNVALLGHSVGILSMEMPKAQVQKRRVSMHSRIPLKKLKRPEWLSDSEWSTMSGSVEHLGKLPVFVSDQSGLTINHMRSKARSLKRRNGLRLLIVDYIGLAEGTDRKANRTIQLAEVSRGLKNLAKELGITILLLCQLNREVEKRQNMRPILSDLRECGDIEQDADIVLFLSLIHI